MSLLGNLILGIITLVSTIIGTIFWAPLALAQRADYLKSVAYNNEMNSRNEQSQVKALNLFAYILCYALGMNILLIYKQKSIPHMPQLHRDSAYCLFWIEMKIHPK